MTDAGKAMVVLIPSERRLIAAAPALLNVVMELIATDQDDTWDTDRTWLVEAARAALTAAQEPKP